MVIAKKFSLNNLGRFLIVGSSTILIIFFAASYFGTTQSLLREDSGHRVLCDSS